MITGEGNMTRVPRETLIKFVQGRCTPEEGLKVLEEIEANPESSRELDLFADILGVFHDTPDLSTVEPSLSSGRHMRRVRRIVGGTLGYFPIRYSIPVAALMVIALFVLIGHIPRIGQGRTTLLETDLSMVEWATRGVSGGDVDAAREAAFRGDFTGARQHILRYVNTAPTEPERACGLITAGALCFLQAQEESRGWWHSKPEAELLRLGTGYLDEATRLQVPASVRNEAHLLLARGLYWLDRRPEANAHLDSVAACGPEDARRAGALRPMITEKP
jgi:hypothetical protein